jgi:hypothetical protein
VVVGVSETGWSTGEGIGTKRSRGSVPKLDPPELPVPTVEVPVPGGHAAEVAVVVDVAVVVACEGAIAAVGPSPDGPPPNRPAGALFSVAEPSRPYVPSQVPDAMVIGAVCASGPT